ncbi:hypothetical protein CUM50_07735 [Enterococcus faecium]|uniref:hypothetical protein n=1 Tax=Bacteria TaxID=2 RepID=UPI000CF227DF|nr:hypothetical protein [Enterococcus faecium]EGP5512679.1 hypothetical protein [Enterococcus faecium]MDQ8214158.1 hypothetical protein [Enterococcus faecium]MDQ8346919.1 hypothetical protein [Enterococcus faecium]NTK43232.1 hypothetical protein [Enterococcus faecium]PQD73274.1 hypothetical protein CUM50_07735 [Enterococcus faecium]
MLDRKSRLKIENLITYLSTRNVSHFYFETVEHYTGLRKDDFCEYLMDMVKNKELSLKYQILCPEYDCGIKETYNNFKEIPFGEFFEDYKGHEFKIEEDMVIPIFFLTENLIEDDIIKKPQLLLL